MISLFRISVIEFTMIWSKSKCFDLNCYYLLINLLNYAFKEILCI